MLVARILKRRIDGGALTLIDARGVRHRLGRRAADGAEIVVRLSDRRLHWKLLLDPERFLGEGYVDGTVTVERGSLYDLLDLGVRSLAPRRPPRAARLRRALVRARAFLRQYNPAGRARRNAAHAYDLPDSV